MWAIAKATWTLVALGQPALPATAPSAPPSPLAREERATYRIDFGVLGQVGEIKLGLMPALDAADKTLRLWGRGGGSILGLVEAEKHIETQFDLAAARPRSWTSVRVQSGKTITDRARQDQPGSVALLRQRSDRPDEKDTFTRKEPLLDPLGFLLRLRLDPPRTPRSYEVLDGRALWIITVAPATSADAPDQPGSGPTLRLEGQAKPIYWDGDVDPDRPTRTFTLVLADDPYRTPLRLVMPLGIGEVRAELSALSRHPATRRHWLVRALPPFLALRRLFEAVTRDPRFTPP